jgi:phosphoserine phosphatase
MTGEIDGAFTTGAGKVAALRRAGLFPPLAAFGDSPSDIPMLRSATGLAGMVNPRPGLRAVSGTMSDRARWVRITRTVAGFDVPVPEQDESTIL